MTINESDVRLAMRQATDHLSSPPALLDDVRRGGRRRRVHRRTMLGAGLAVGVAAATAGDLRWRGSGAPMDVASPLIDTPTRGDLARDETFLDRVRLAWSRAMDGGDTRMYGEPQIVWAGNTPAGPAAFVIQRTAENPVVAQPSGDRLWAVSGFVHRTPAGLRIMTTTTMSGDRTNGVPQAALLGVGYDVLLVIDFGAPVHYSPALSYAPDGRIVRDFQPLPFHDGAAVQRVPPQRTKITVAVGRQPLGRHDIVHLANSSDIVSGGRAGGGNPPQVTHVLPGADRAWGGDPETVLGRGQDQVEPALTDYVDQVGFHVAGDHPYLTVYGATPDGRRLLLQTIQYDDDPARYLLMLAAPGSPFTVVAGKLVAAGSREPVWLRLPDGQGTLLAAEGASLRYRVAGGPWQDAGRDAALLPSPAVEAEVTRGGTPQLITL